MEALDAAQLAQLNDYSRNSMAGALGIEVLAADDDHIVARMPLSDKVRQPFGILHGGATVALCETAASVGTFLHIDGTKFRAVGLEINANHLRSVREGHVTVTGRPVHRGRSTWVWELRVEDDAGKLVAISRCTMAVVPR